MCMMSFFLAFSVDLLYILNNKNKLNCVTRSILLSFVCNSRYVTTVLRIWKTMNLVLQYTYVQC